MKKTILILTLVCVAAFLVFSLAFSQGEKTTGVADSVKKEVTQPDTTAKKDTTKVEAAVKKDTTKAEAAATKDTTKAVVKVVHKYIGTSKCKMCHNSEAKGKIYDTWAATGHSKAYQTLANDQSKAVAKKAGIDDATKSEKCLKCHVTGYKEPNGDKYAIEEGVTCEACHGPGEHYWPMKMMQNKKLAMDNGLVEPTEALCVKCHNKESPTYKPFKFADEYKLIEHHAPKKAPATEKK
ncbi:MAG: cytochrome c family protein [Candidatus Zixiibacteriota bacterium]